MVHTVVAYATMAWPLEHRLVSQIRNTMWAVGSLSILFLPSLSVLAFLNDRLSCIGMFVHGGLCRRGMLPIKKLVVGLWVGSAGPPSGVHQFTRPFCRRCAPGLNWPGRASGAVTMKKLECSKQAYALYTLAWDNIIGFRSYYVGLRDRSGGAWPFLVGGAICLVNSVNERDLSLLTSYVEVCDALRCFGPHARYTDVFNEYIALADRPRKSLKFHRDGDRSLQLLVFNEEFLNPVNHRVFERKLRPKPSGRRHACLGVTHRVAPNHASLIGTHGIGAEIGLPCLWCGWPKLESPSVDARLVVVEKTLVLCRAS
ncbi:hypothetical protein L2E82_09227 [Cichorium intybus]|uniref:Uncharacterized protein n=1 Tax=Cichorium intybus TaxID=13427 RepID=A0ACB9G8V9_CICIN|nr:hypothetical protein L2E82_09227 [Cichorium intybus]